MLIGVCHKHDYRDEKCRHVLLVRQITINRDECIELWSRQCQLRAVLYTTPTHFNDGFDGMCGQCSAKTAGYRLIKQQIHERKVAPSLLQARLRPLHERLTGSPSETLPKTSCLPDNRTGSKPARVFL